ncbi:hypothetical protein D9758_010522 [Tetrapyrgos nigripes]|uniref:NADP-dependent oxidoreductase domain-containing protein n=1 Tax=Tetrapyrgos nigripes TaxID=182062 RepID=A0A8H5FW34_9AGAR|nr:hypothetical protein D9758_010522 [Tetrapyrgos nigripes]
MDDLDLAEAMIHDDVALTLQCILSAFWTNAHRFSGRDAARALNRPVHVRITGTVNTDRSRTIAKHTDIVSPSSSFHQLTMPSDRPHPFAPHPKPSNSLGVLRVLSPRAGVRVSPICLGGGNIGDRWPGSSMTKEKSFEYLDAFFERGGNFIDTANNYQEEASEEYIGEWMESRGI